MANGEDLKNNVQTSAKKSRIIVYGAAVLFSLIVGFSFLAVKTSMEVGTPLEILTYRFNFAAIAAVIPLMVRVVKIDLTGKSLKRLSLTVVFFVGFMAFQALGLIYATSIESGIIFAIVPILSKIIAYYYLAEKGDWKQNAFITLSIAAVIAMFLFSLQGFQGVSVKGFILLLISCLLSALSNVLIRGVRSEFSPYAIAFLISIGGCVFFNAVTLMTSAIRGEPLQYLAPLAHWEFVVGSAFLGILSTLVTSLLMAYMLANMETVKATIFGNLSTAISIFAGVIFLREPLYIYHIVCTIFIIIGVIGTSLNGAPKPDKDREEE